MSFRKVIEVINPSKPGDPFVVWFQNYERGHTIGEKWHRDFTHHEYNMFVLSEILFHQYRVPEKFIGDFVELVRQVYEDEMMENMSRHVED